MAKKEKKGAEEEEVGETDAKTASTVVQDDGEIFVNREKFERAKGIVDLVSGKKVPANDQEAERKDHYVAKFAEAEISPKDKGAVRFAYESLLGGLIRTQEEQAEADDEAAEAKKKNRKKAVE